MAISAGRTQTREVLEGGCDLVPSMRIDKRLSVLDDRSWVPTVATAYVGDRAVVVQRKIHNRPEIYIKTEVTQFIGGSIVESLGDMRGGGSQRSCRRKRLKTSVSPKTRDRPAFLVDTKEWSRATRRLAKRPREVSCCPG
jgi:hypothetical protein